MLPPSSDAPAGSADRGQNAVLGFALLFGLIAVTSAGTLLVGNAALSDVEGQASLQRAESAMTQFDSQAAQVALGESQSQQITLGSSGNAQVTVDDDAGRITMRVINDTTTRTIIDKEFGAVVYDTGDEVVAYQGGGVWRGDGNTSRMISPPEYHYRKQTLTFPIIRVTGESWSGSPGNGVTVTREGFQQKYPSGSLNNPLEDGRVYVTITSDYHQGWASYFRSRTDGTIDHDPSTQTVEVNLTVPFTATFDNAVTATSDDSDAISTTGNANFDGPQVTNATRPSASAKIDQRVSDCQSGGCADLSSELGDNKLENDTYYHNGDITIGPSTTEYDTSAGDINIVVNGDLTFKGSGGPGTSDHYVTGGNRVNIYLKGNLEISGNGAVNTGGDSGDFIVLVHSTAGSVTAASGTPQFTGLIYAPNTDLVINGGGACGTGGPGGGTGGGTGGGPPWGGGPGGPPALGGPELSLPASGAAVGAGSPLLELSQFSAAPPSCEGNIVGAIVVEEASAVGVGNMHYDPPADYELEFDEAIEITYLHVTENRIKVSGD